MSDRDIVERARGVAAVLGSSKRSLSRLLLDLADEVSDRRTEVEDFQAATRSACEQRDDLAARVTALQAAVDSKADWRPPARQITDPDELTALPVNARLITPTDGWRHIGGGRWDTPSDNRVVHSESVIGAAEGVGPVVVADVPTEEARDGE